MLQELGLAPDVELVYRAVVARPDTTETVLAEVVAISAADVATAVAQLVDAGLVLRGGGESLVAAPPAVALGALITERRDRLRLAEQALATLAEQHRAAIGGRDVSDLLEVVTGVEAIRHRYRQVQLAAEAELRMFVTAPFVAVPPGENAAEPAAVSRGVAIRAILDRAVLAVPGAIDEVDDSLRRGLELRVVDTLPMKLVIADDELALVPLTGGHGGEPGAVLLQRSELLGALGALFESLWRDAYPLTLAQLVEGSDPADLDRVDGPSPLDLRVLALMLAGLSDQAVASQLDLSLRTVQRRLRHLHDLAGASSRMQLGWYAARQGWA